MSDRKKVLIALGYFDSVHKGHRKVIDLCVKKAGKDFIPVVFTFKGNLKKAIGKDNGKFIFDYKERESILSSIGVNEVLLAPVSKTFLKKGKKAFLNYINAKYDIKGYVCGEDFRFGKGGNGDVSYLKEYAKSRCQTVDVVDILKDDGEKISTSRIKECLRDGKIEKANSFLGFDYFLTGKVYKDRKMGTKLGYPTVNVKTDSDRFLIKEGVYSGYVIIDKNKYGAVINYGARPTFDLQGKLVEAHILNFNGNLYGKKIRIYFNKYIREIKKFANTEELKEQIKKDINKVVK